MERDDDDLNVECQVYREYAAALESLAPLYRKAERLLPQLDEPAREAIRAELRGVTRRSIGTATLALAILNGSSNPGVKP